MVYSAAPSKPALSSLRIHVKPALAIRDWFESDFTTGQSQTWCNPDETQQTTSTQQRTHTHTHTHTATHLERGVVQNFNMSVCLSVCLSVCVCVSRGRRWLSMTSVLSLSLYSCCLSPIHTCSQCCCSQQSYAPITRAYAHPLRLSSPPIRRLNKHNSSSSHTQTQLWEDRGGRSQQIKTSRSHGESQGCWVTCGRTRHAAQDVVRGERIKVEENFT